MKEIDPEPREPSPFTVQALQIGVALAISFALLAGCVSPEQQAARDQRVAQRYHDRCAAMGAQTQEQFFQCRLQMQQADQARAAAYRNALDPVFDQMISGTPQQQTYQRPVTCRSIPEGIMVRTVCN